MTHAVVPNSCVCKTLAYERKPSQVTGALRQLGQLIALNPIAVGLCTGTRTAVASSDSDTPA